MRLFLGYKWEIKLIIHMTIEIHWNFQLVEVKFKYKMGKTIRLYVQVTSGMRLAIYFTPPSAASVVNFFYVYYFFIFFKFSSPLVQFYFRIFSFFKLCIYC